MDLRRSLEQEVARHACTAAFVLAGIGSLSRAQIRYVGAPAASTLDGDLELLSLSGTVAANGAHLHGALATATGVVLGGHLAYGCMVRTTAEVLLALMPEWHFTRESDTATGCAELVARRAVPIDGS